MLCVEVGVASVNGGVASGLCGLTLHCILARCYNTFPFVPSPGGAVDVAGMHVG